MIASVPGVLVPLTRSHSAFAAQVGWRRVERIMRNGSQQSDPTLDSRNLGESIARHMVGAVVETAWWCWQGIWPGMLLRDDWSPDDLDDDRGADLKGTTHLDGRLLVTRESALRHPEPEIWWVLGIWHGPRVWIVGGMQGRDLLVRARWGEHGQKDRPCYGAEQAELTAPDVIRAALGRP